MKRRLKKMMMMMMVARVDWTVTKRKCTATHTSSSRCISNAATSSTWWTSSCRASCCPCSSWSASVCLLTPERRSHSASPSSWRSPSFCSWSPTPSREPLSPFRSSVKTSLIDYWHISTVRYKPYNNNSNNNNINNFKQSFVDVNRNRYDSKPAALESSLLSALGC